MRVMLIGVALLVGCGRWRFDEILVDDTRQSGATDAPEDATVATYGDDGMAQYPNVARDTFISLANPDVPYGSDPSLVLAGAPATRALISFDISTIPRTASVFSASLRLTSVQGPGPMGCAARAYVLLEAWDENSATYNERSAGVLWTATGALQPSSGPTVIGSVAVSATVTTSEMLLDRSIVEDWVRNPPTNFGVVLMAGCDVTITSREGTTLAERPVLTVTYLP